MLLRLSQWSRRRQGVAWRPLALVLGAVYRWAGLAVCSVDIPISTKIGPRLQIHHGMALVVHARAVLGSDVVLRQCTTIGSSHAGSGAPRLGDRVSIGPNAVVLGEIELGHDVVVGAGSVVLRDAEPGAVLVGNPARSLTR